MAECYACHTALQGSWSMTSGYGYARTGRNLGITNGHFLHHPGPNWVYSYCEACWKNAVLALPFVPRTSQALQEQNNALTQQLEISSNEKTSLEQQLRNLRQENTLLTGELDASRMIDANLKESLSEMRIESATLKQKNKELNERCSYVLYIAGIEKLHEICRQLKPTQIDALKTQTNFHIDQLDERYTQRQLRCSEQFTQSIVMDLQTKLKTIIAEQNKVLEERQKTKENVIKLIKRPDTPQEVLNEMIRPYQALIDQTMKSIDEWNTFFAILMSAFDERATDSRFCQKCTNCDWFQ